MTAARTISRKKMGISTLLGSIFIIATIVWGLVSFVEIQGNMVRTEIPHEEYSSVAPWPYNIEWSGGKSNWFDNLNYTDVPLDQQLPEDLLDQLDHVIFYVTPEGPPQLWRIGAYDEYDGSSWGKSSTATADFKPHLITRQDAEAIGNQIYTVVLNVTAGPNVGSIEIPTLFPSILVIQDSFTTGHVENGVYQRDAESRLIQYDLETDDYGTLMFSPMIEAPTGEHVLISYDITFENQDLTNIADNALPGDQAPPNIRDMYGRPALAGVQLTQRVIDNISQFEGVGDNALETASIVATYFQNTFSLMINESQYAQRPESGREVTDWFLERGGGLPMDFATAYCVFMRYLDIPARLVIGYAVGDPEGGYRTIRVRHMMFWAEVYVPMAPTGEGEWVQIIPIPLPSEMGGGEVPENVPEGAAQIYVWPNVEKPWVVTGEEFVLSALLTVNQVPVTAGEQIIFRDVTDDRLMGAADIREGKYLPLANLTYAFPDTATPGLHNITAIYQGETFTVQNFTSIYVVAQPNPYSSPSLGGGFVLSATVDVDLQLGLDTYVALWDDALHIHGLMTVGGNPVDGTTLNNDQIQIMWDDYFLGNATIQSDGTYSLDTTVDPFDPRMSLGPHEVWSQYLGEYTDEGIPVLLPARSADNSTVTVKGTSSITLSVTPTLVYRGSTLHYEGVAVLDNGTALAFEQIGIFFDGSQVGTVQTNSTGGFTYNYVIPSSQSDGTYPAQANWSSTMTNILGTWSNSIDVQVLTNLVDLTIDSSPRDPDVVHPYQQITIFGNATDQVSSSPLVGYNVTVWWDTGAGAIMIGSAITDSNGYYEVNYTVPDTYFGTVQYWAHFDPGTSGYQATDSLTLNITVQKWITEVSIASDINPAHPGETITFSGTVSLPEAGGVALGNAPVTIWWANGTETFNLTTVLTSSTTGLYEFAFDIPIDHEFGTVTVHAEFVSPVAGYDDDVSDDLYITITNYTTTISIQSNSTYYHLNETAYIWGQLLYYNGTPITGASVTLSWTNAMGTSYYALVTNGTGYYNFYYNISITTDNPGSVTVAVKFVSSSRLHSDAEASTTITLQLYQMNLSASLDASEYHRDDVMTFSGTLTFQENGKPLAGATITIYYRNSIGVYTFQKVTDPLGQFTFLYNCSVNDGLGAIYIWAHYTSTDPLWADGESANRTATIILYRLALTTSTSSTSYHLNETIQVYGRLTFQDNGTAIANQPVTVFMNWHNGTVLSYGPYYTNAMGYFTFYYNCSVPRDSPATVTFWAEFYSSNELWDNASSSPGADVDLVLYTLQLTISAPSPVYIDESIVIQGTLSYSGGSPVLSGKTVNLYLLDGGTWVLVTSLVTDSAGNYVYLYNFSQSQFAGDYQFKTNYTRTSLLNTNASSSVLVVTVQRRPVIMEISVTPTTIKLNETTTISLYIHFANGTPIVGQYISVVWNNGTAHEIFSGPTNGAGEIELAYSELEGHTIWTGIQVYASFAGTRELESNESVHIGITLEQWQTLITGFSTGGISDFHVSETVTVQGYLYYDVPDPDVPFAQANVTLVFDGAPVGWAITDGAGYFEYSWVIPVGTSAGLHEIRMNYIPTVTWIAPTLSSSITLNITAYELVWTLTVTPTDPAYRSDLLNITGTLYLDNGSAYAGATVTIYWNHLASGSGAIMLAQYMTGADGSFQHIFNIPATTPLGPTTIWAECTPSQDYINPGSSDASLINILQIPVNLTILTYSSTVYLGQSVTVTGLLMWGNGTGDPMVGYDIAVVWDGTIVDTSTTNNSGGFLLSYTVPWTNDLGYISMEIRFVQPDESFEQASSQVQVEVRAMVTIVLDDQPTDTLVRGGTISVTGIIDSENGGVAGVPVVLLVDGEITGYTGTSNNDGQFVLDLTVPIDVVLGPHNLSVAIQAEFYDLSEEPGAWDMVVVASSEVSVYVPETYVVANGETFRVDIRLLDDVGQPINGTVIVHLNGTEITSVQVFSTTWVSFNVPVPSSWSQSGYFTVDVVYEGNPTAYIDGSDDESTTAIHVFTGVEFTRTSPERVASGSPLVISGTIVDDSPNHYPIAGRTVTIVVNGSAQSVLTDENGNFSVTVVQRTVNGTYTVAIALPVADTNITVASFTVLAQANTGGNMQVADLIIPGIALAGAIVAVLLYLYFVRGFFRGAPRTTGIDIPSKLRNIKKLADAGKYDAAVTLAYRTFEQMCGLKSGTERLNSETAREYLDRVLKSLPLDPAVVEQFVQIYEEARFSQHEITRSQYEEAVRIFTDLYPRIDVGVTAE